MKHVMTSVVLAASLCMTAGMALANGQNDTTDIHSFGNTTSQNGQNDNVQANAQDAGAYPTLTTYVGNH